MLIVASGDSRQKDSSALLTFSHGAIFSCFGSKWGRRQVNVLVLFSSASEILLSANSSLSGEWKGRDPRERKPQLSNRNESLSNFIPGDKDISQQKTSLFSALTKLLAKSTYIKCVPLDMK